MARVTIIIPTHNHGRLLLVPVRSVLRQTVQDFELFIIGDGINEETREAVAQALVLDKRIRFFDHPKSPRTGEPYRHQALQEATGEVVCYLADDDIWMAHHLESMCRTLKKVDMAHALPLCVNGEGAVISTLVDLGLPEWVQWTLDGNCKTSLSFVGHTMEFYRRLPHGWRTTPAGSYTDHYMWVQMLSVPGMRATCTGEYSLIGFPHLMRKGRTPERREEELLAWEKKQCWKSPRRYCNWRGARSPMAFTTRRPAITFCTATTSSSAPRTKCCGIRPRCAASSGDW